MRRIIRLFPLALALASTSLASPIPSGQIPENAKWVAHLDLDKLQHSKLGETLAKQFLDPQLGQMAEKLHKDLGIEFDWRKIHGLTAYGTNLKKKPDAHTVVLVQSELPLRDALNTALARLRQAGVIEKDLPIQRLDQEGQEVFTFNKEIYASLAEKNLLVLGKSQRAVSNAIAMLQGKGATTSKSSILTETTAGDASFLSLRLSETFHEGLDLPPQAQALKMTEGAKLSLGEAADSLVAKLALRTKTAEAVEQLQQALQGVLALATLGTAENVQLQQLLKGIHVDHQDREVNVALQYPLAELMKFIDSKKPQKSAQR